MGVAALFAGPEPALAATLQVSWASNTEADLAGYRLRVGTSPGVYAQPLEAGAATSFEIDNLDTDVTYYIAVFAYDYAGNESADSAEVTALIPSTPVLLPVVDGVMDVSSGSMFLIRGAIHPVIVSGSNLQPGAAINLGQGIWPARIVQNSDGTLGANVLVFATAAPGNRTLTVTNPDGATSSLSDAVAIVKTPDTNRDCSVDILDLNAIARAWNTTSTDPGYADSADLDGDDYVGPEDLTIFVKFLGRPLPGCP